jgi:hypothetical protein
MLPFLLQGNGVGNPHYYNENDPFAAQWLRNLTWSAAFWSLLDRLLKPCTAMPALFKADNKNAKSP